MNSKYMQRLVNLIKDSSMDALFIAPSDELKYLFDFSPYLCERFQGMFIKENGDFFYFCNLLTKHEVEKHLPGKNIFSWTDNEMFIDRLVEVLNQKNLIGAKIGVNSTARAFNILEITKNCNLKFINGKEIIEEIRISKTKKEIELLKEAGRRTDKVIEKAIDYIKPGMTEKNIIKKIEILFKEQEMKMEFGIVSRGKNTSIPHYTDNDDVIQNKDIVLLDIGGKYRHICSDMTRTIFVGGITEEEHKVYNTVLEANKLAIKKAVIGTKIKELDNVARTYIKKEGFGEYFITRLGHGIGYSTHEKPYINRFNERRIEEGMAFSIEPGIYIRNKFGVRIEDIIVIENGKPTIVNNFPKHAIII
jgi:Xaa-Pro dipeptidase